MPFPTKTCAVCSQQFELRPDKPGFANRCPDCTEAEAEAAEAAAKKSSGPMTKEERKSQSEQNEARRSAIRDLLYRKDS